MAHRSEIDLLYKAEIQDLRAILIRTLPGALGPVKHQPHQRPQTTLPPEPAPPLEPTVADVSDTRDLLNFDVNYDVETCESPGSGVGANSSAFERGEDMILMDPFSDEQL